MAEIIVISDIHLGSRICQAKHLLRFFHTLSANELILNGDVFDSWDFRHLGKHEWKVLSKLRKLSKRMKVVWINGNHDGPAEIISQLIGIEVKEEYIITSGDKRILILHGHQFDEFITNHPVLTWIGDLIYHILQRIDRTFWIARTVKKASKSFLRNAKKVRMKSVETAKRKKCDFVCCGHTHNPEISENYCNSGSWAELPAHYIEINKGEITLCEFSTESAAKDSDIPEDQLPLLTN